jgi:hypothetical protein
LDSLQSIIETIRPKLEELEVWRLELRQKARKSFVWGVPVAAVGLIMALFTPIGFVLILAGALIMIISHAVQASKFKKEFKERILPVIIEAVEPGVVYTSNHKISLPVFRHSELFLKHVDRYTGEDHFDGMIGKTALEFSEIHAEEKHESRNSKGHKRTHYTTIFKGVFMIADFNKHFSAKTVVLPDTSEKFLGRLGRRLQKWNFAREDLVVLESPEFENEFVVYGSDQIESRYILTPDLMSRFLELKKRTGHSIYASFKESRLFLAISLQNNLFESSFRKSLLEGEVVEEIVSDLQFCFGIVEDLNLNTRIWTKE